VVVPDLVGFGRSDKPADRADYSYQAHLDWYGAFLDALDLRDILLFCQDWGGQLGTVQAARQPERHRAVIAANTGVLPGFDLNLPPDHVFWDWCDYAEKLEPFRPSEVVGSAGSPLNTEGKVLTEGEARAYDAPFPSEAYCAGARAFPPLNVTRGDQAGADICLDAWQRLASFDRPFVVVVAEHEPSFGALAPLFLSTVPGAAGRDKVDVPGAGHYLQELAADTLVELVNEVDAAITA
jgi:haloalkane dehalogenase